MGFESETQILPFLMDLQPLKKALVYSQRKKRWVIALAVMGVSGYGAYKVYHLPAVARKRRRLLKLFGALISVAEVVADSAETMSLLSKDMKEFLQSESDEIPNSLKQLSKIARSDEFSASMARITEAMTIGILRGHQSETKNVVEGGSNSSFSDQIMDKMMSKSGTGFISVVVGSFARNLVLAIYSNGGNQELGGDSGSSSSSSTPKWVSIVSDERFKLVIAHCIQTFVSSSVSAYLDRTLDVNVYDEMFSGLTNPKHQTQVKDFVVSLCNGAVETLVKTSHHVLTTAKSDPSPSNLMVDHVSVPSRVKSNSFDQVSNPSVSNGLIQDSGWVNAISSTLAVPDNRRFVLDVTGRVTFETIRSLLGFFMWKLFEGFKKSFNVVHEEVMERGLQVVRYFGAKSSVIVTVCLALYLYLVGGARVLLPA